MRKLNLSVLFGGILLLGLGLALPVYSAGVPGGPPPPATVTVTIAKYVNGIHATAINANSVSFPMTATWSATNIGSGSGSFSLGPVGFNNPNPYEATTSDMDAGADYSTAEITDGNPVLGINDPCVPGQYKLLAYSWGDTELDAQFAPLSSVPPSFTGLTTNKFVIVWNELCPTYGSLTVTKKTIGADGTFSFTGDAGAFSITTAGNTGSQQITNLLPGTYSVSEDQQTHWQEVSNDCKDVIVIAGQDTSCTIINQHDTRINIVKQTVGDTGSFHFVTDNQTIGEFNIDTTGQPNNKASSFFDIFTEISVNNPNGTANITITEDQIPGWDLTSHACVYNNQSVGQAVPNGETVTVESGDEVTCTFTNTKYLKVHILKYLNGVKATSASSSGYQFPMTASWSAANIGSGTGNYVLGNSHGGAPDQYGADTTLMQAPADYTTSEVTGGNSQVLPFGSPCQAGMFVLLGYSASSISFADAALQPVSSTAPVFTGITTDQYVIVWNKACVAPPPANACTLNSAPFGYTLVLGTPGNDNVPLAPNSMFIGMGGNDKILGTNGNYIICTLSGNDSILIGNGDFTIDAGSGTNVIKTGAGAGIIITGSGADTISTGNGAQTILAGDGLNTIVTGNGNKTVTTGTGIDKIVTGSGNDIISAGNGANIVKAGAGSDTITSGTGNDIIDGGVGVDVCNAGGGINTVINCP